MGRGSVGGGGSRGMSTGSVRPSGGPRPAHGPGGPHPGPRPAPRSSGLWNWILPAAIISNVSRGGGSSNNASNDENGGGASNVAYKKVRNKTATLVVGLIFLAITIVCIVCANIFTYRTTTATVIRYETSVEYNTTFYYGYYSYTINGKQYTEIKSQVGWTDVDNYPEGSTCKIYYKVQNHNIIYEVDDALGNKPGDYKATCYILAVIFGIITICIFAFGINNHVPIERSAASETATFQAPLTDGQTRCRYCGGILQKDDTTCPSCGARKG